MSQSYRDFIINEKIEKTEIPCFLNQAKKARKLSLSFFRLSVELIISQHQSSLTLMATGIKTF